MEKVIDTLNKIIYRFFTIKDNAFRIGGGLLNRRELDEKWPKDDITSTRKEAKNLPDLAKKYFCYCCADFDDDDDTDGDINNGYINNFENEAKAKKDRGKDEIVPWANEKKAWINANKVQIKAWIAQSKAWVADKCKQFPFKESFNGVDEFGNSVVISFFTRVQVPWCKSFELLGDNLNKLDGLVDELDKNLDDLIHAWDK
jgi:hypothetical protein